MLLAMTSNPAATPTISPAEQLLALASGAWVTQMIHVAAELGLADLLAVGEREVSDLASACGANADALYRLLRGLAGQPGDLCGDGPAPLFPHPPGRAVARRSPPIAAPVRPHARRRALPQLG
jgi:hypothetical protein